MQFLVPKASRWLLLLLQVYSLLRLVRSLGLVSDFGSCSTSANYTNGSQFQKNLNALLTSLVAKGPSKGYFVTDVGRYPDQVYGLVQCTGGVSATDCARCLQTASTEIVQSCPNGKDAYSFYEGCLLRYSNESFVSKLSESGKWMMMFNTQNISNPTRFNELLGDLLKNLSQKAPSDPSMFATGETKFTDFQNIYGFAQCSRDLSLDDCDTCLKDAITYIPGCCNGKQGARIISMSCNIRYEIYPFSESSRNPPPAPTGTGSAPNSSHPLEPITTTGRRRPSRFVVAITSAMAALGTALLVSCACYILRRKKTPKKVEKRETGHEDLFQDFGEETSTGFSYVDVLTGNLGKGKDLPLIDLATILAATDNFSSSNKLGQGGFGPVYKGKLIDGKEIAVKRLSRSSGQGVEEFKNEIILIAKLQHKNLVRLLCCCLEREEKLLIYEYMPNRSLDVFLFDPVRCLELDWERRFNIISGIARGLLYLHEDSRLKVIHRDLKASNILLDSQMNPKISDFGMARIFGVNQSEANTNRVVGTYGYMAPEYAMEGLFSVKSDVFSFGVLLLEIITGKKNGRFYLSGYAQSLLVYAWQLWSEGKAIELIDPLLAESCPTNEVLRYIHISLLCVQEDAADRPTMEKIVLMLSSDSVTLSQPKQPAFSVGRIIVSSNRSLERKVSSVNDVTISEFEPR